MAVDNASIHLKNIKEDILDRFDWQNKTAENGVKYWECFIANSFNLKQSKNHRLKLILKKDKQTDFYKLIVRNSLRKWYFNRNGTRDLYKMELWDCLYKLSQVLDISFEEILDAKITQIELGFTTLLKPIYRKLQEGMYFYGRLDRWTYNETTYFGFKNSSYHLKFYDKLAECYKHTSNAKQLKELNQKIYFMRFEISINEVSAVSFYKDNVSTFRDLFSNWDKVMDKIYKTASKVCYIDWMSDFKTTKIDNNALLEKEIYYKGIQNKGLHKIMQQIKNFDSTNRSHYRNKLEKFILENSKGDLKKLQQNYLYRLNRKIQIVCAN